MQRQLRKDLDGSALHWTMLLLAFLTGVGPCFTQLNVIARYRRLGFWSKLGALGSIASLISFPPLWFAFSGGQPSIQNSATVGNSSTVIQAGNNSTVSINPMNANVATKEDIESLRKQVETCLKLLREKADENNDALLSKYRYGYILVRNLVRGTQKAIVRESRLQGSFKVEADWDATSLVIDRTAQKATVSISNLHFVTGSLDMTVGTTSDTFLLREGYPIQTKIMRLGNAPNMFYEILDLEKEIFVVGFK
jgi:hypothetical protein